MQTLSELGQKPCVAGAGIVADVWHVAPAHLAGMPSQASADQCTFSSCAQGACPPLAVSLQRLQQDLAALQAGSGKARAANKLLHDEKENLMQLLLSEKRRVSADPWCQLSPP